MTRPAPPSPDILSVGAFPPSLPPIPSAEQEAADVAATYQRVGVPATVLREASASRAGFERLRADGELERFTVLHLATHGDDTPLEEPGEAALYLADGRVDAMEISQWILRADLVALSACWSGRRPVHVRAARAGSPGQTPPARAEELFGDEIYGLQAAFFAAGARQIPGSLWPVADRPAAAVMRAFHADVAAGQPAEIALQAAINQQRHAGRPAAHWAPYKLTVLGRIGQAGG
jgi:CHAT domain-containing protein